jgi:hypothetical protein
VRRERTAHPLPELDEAQDLVGFFALADIGVGVTEGATLEILRKTAIRWGRRQYRGRSRL